MPGAPLRVWSHSTTTCVRAPVLTTVHSELSMLAPLLRRCSILRGITASEGRLEAMGCEPVAGECRQCMHAVAMQDMGACMDTAAG